MDKIWQWYNIGMSSSNPDKRFIGRNVTSGWDVFIDDWVRPTNEWLDKSEQDIKKRVWLHNPFGVTPGSIMEADQYIECKKVDHLYKVTDEFVKHWRPLIEDEGIELCMYMGSPRHDETLKAQYKPGRIDNYLQLLWRCYRIPLELGCSLALDAGANAVYDGVAFHASNLLKALMKEAGLSSDVWVEATPRRDVPHMHRHNATALETTFRKRHYQPQGSSARSKFPYFDREDKTFKDDDGTTYPGYGGKIVRLFHKDAVRKPGWLHDCFTDGHEAAIRINSSIWKESIDELMKPAPEPTPD